MRQSNSGGRQNDGTEEDEVVAGEGGAEVELCREVIQESVLNEEVEDDVGAANASAKAMDDMFAGLSFG